MKTQTLMTKSVLLLQLQNDSVLERSKAQLMS